MLNAINFRLNSLITDKIIASIKKYAKKKKKVIKHKRGEKDKAQNIKS
jgi:hypothetical protein